MPVPISTFFRPVHPSKACSYILTSETYIAFGSTLDTLLSDAAVQFISCVIDEDELKSIWEQWSEEGGEQIKAEYTAAYQAANMQ